MQVEVKVPSHESGVKGSSIRLDDALLTLYRKEVEALGSPRPVRLAYAAVHVVMRDDYRTRPHSPARPGDAASIADFIDWEATGRIRQRISSLGFGIAEAMDTAHRFRIGWKAAERLIRECGRLHLTPRFIAGAGADHLTDIANKRKLIEAVVYQANFIQEAGGQVILLPLPWLTRNRLDESAYVEIYGEIIRSLSGPLFIHWLGEKFMPELAGYFPGQSFDRIMALDPAKVRGTKLSLLDSAFEISCREKLIERDQIVFTGDDFNFESLIRGDHQSGEEGAVGDIARWVEIGDSPCALGNFSHALLGAFDGIAEPAGLALRYLACGRVDRYRELMLPSEELSRTIFEAPTGNYKAGLAFLSWLNGHQENFMLVNHEEKGRDRDHYLRVVELAARARVISNASLAAERLRTFLEKGKD